MASFRDPEHAEARRRWDLLTAEGVPIATSDWIVAELVQLCERRLGREVALSVGGLILGEPTVRLLMVDRSIILAAWARYGKRAGPSLIDCVSFELMRRDGMDRAFAFDSDFIREGFKQA